MPCTVIISQPLCRHEVAPCQAPCNETCLDRSKSPHTHTHTHAHDRASGNLQRDTNPNSHPRWMGEGSSKLSRLKSHQCSASPQAFFLPCTVIISQPLCRHEVAPCQAPCNETCPLQCTTRHTHTRIPLFRYFLDTLACFQLACSLQAVCMTLAAFSHDGP